MTKRVVMCRIGKKAIVEDIETDLKTLQKIVDGYVECLNLGTSVEDMDDIDLWLNEEGRFSEPLNRVIPAVVPKLSELFKDAMIIKVDPDLADPGQDGVWEIFGNFFLARRSEDGKIISLTDSDIQKITDLMDRLMVRPS